MKEPTQPPSPKVELPVEEAKVELPAEEAKVELPVEEVKVELPAEEVKVAEETVIPVTTTGLTFSSQLQLRQFQIHYSNKNLY